MKQQKQLDCVNPRAVESADDLTAWRGLALKETVDRGAEHILLQRRQNTQVAVGMISPNEIVLTLERRVAQVSVR
jgi:hypothetical protein